MLCDSSDDLCCSLKGFPPDSLLSSIGSVDPVPVYLQDIAYCNGTETFVSLGPSWQTDWPLGFIFILLLSNDRHLGLDLLLLLLILCQGTLF